MKLNFCKLTRIERYAGTRHSFYETRQGSNQDHEDILILNRNNLTMIQNRVKNCQFSIKKMPPNFYELRSLTVN